MRISIEQGDRAYVSPGSAESRRVKSVHVDGVLYEGCVTIDTDEGYVKCFKPSDCGTPGKFAPPIGDRFPMIEVRGNVVLELAGERDWSKDHAPDRAHSKVAVGRLDGLLVVDVYSAVRPGAIRRMTMSADAERRSTSVAQNLGACAGAAAEDLCERFGDTIDPSEVARVAVEQCARLLADEAHG